MGGTSSKSSVYEEESRLVIKETNDQWNLKYEHEKLLDESVQLPCSVAELPENAGKNRDSNKCFDFNRVILPGKDGSDFINASWVDGYKTPGKFLLCQAPLRETVQDWWTMIFAHKIRVIVMLTRIVEQDQEACFPYWSQVQQTSVNFGEFCVETNKVKVSRDHVVTSLRVTDASGASLDVQHFAYINWPSQQVPQDPLGFYNFLSKVRKAQSKAELHEKDILPMLVHSSAGLNRAGAFAAIENCFTQYSQSKTIDLLSVARSLRKQRRDCLSLPQHYVFCHKFVSRELLAKLDEYTFS